eukprot:scpid32900/ scgid9316/ 
MCSDSRLERGQRQSRTTPCTHRRAAVARGRGDMFKSTSTFHSQSSAAAVASSECGWKRAVWHDIAKSYPLPLELAGDLGMYSPHPLLAPKSTQLAKSQDFYLQIMKTL